MDVASLCPNRNTQTDQHPLLMEQQETPNGHIINITRSGEALSTLSQNDHHSEMHLPQNEDLPDGGPQDYTHQGSSFFATSFSSRNSSLSRRGEGYGHHSRSIPFNSGLWISVELVVTVSQIIATIVVLSLSRNDNPQALLFEWIVGYAAGCVATLPTIYWRFRNRNQSADEDTSQPSQGSSVSNPPESIYTAIYVSRVSDEENGHATESAARNTNIPGAFTSMLSGLAYCFKMTLDFFFAVWFVIGTVWIFGVHSAPSDAPQLYRLCIVFLSISCIRYAMPFILSAKICWCLPCILSDSGFPEDFSLNGGATVEYINTLPIYKFKLKNNKNGYDQDVNAGIDEGGILAAGTDKERVISGEDAVCCICLAKYADDDELRELPCFHVFHVWCVDKWLKIKGSCPLCKSEVGIISGGWSP
ncbi:E3 ubiquitin-protein ligase At1g63170 [Gastrolobium bilobum]|uniref:E3 ubiquitin-protein ligase At1g63170 n=1 Tax=Gastrolobium bilobum TaxID=150636 RepID=UPI002AB1982C|nr:E3 ubiquitin-protein ligase At1g63170 [Gastrolobium bilobum]